MNLYKFCAFIHFKGDADLLRQTVKSLRGAAEFEDGTIAILCDQKRYMLALGTIFDLECYGKCFFGFNDLKVTREIVQLAAKSDISSFLCEGDTVDPYYFKYLRSFFKNNESGCNAVFVPHNSSSEFFDDIPLDGIRKCNRNAKVPMRGAAILSSALRSPKDGDTLYGVIRKAAVRNGQYGIISAITLDTPDDETEGTTNTTVLSVNTVSKSEPLPEEPDSNRSEPNGLIIKRIQKHSDSLILTASLRFDSFALPLVMLDDGLYYGENDANTHDVIFKIPASKSVLCFYLSLPNGNPVPLDAALVDGIKFIRDSEWIIMPTDNSSSLRICPFLDYSTHLLEMSRAANTMNVMFSFNENLANYASVTMVSLYLNHPDIRIDIYVVYNVLSERVKDIMKTTAVKYHQNIHFVHCHDPWSYDRFERYSGAFECYFDLLPHVYLPETLDRVLYLDVDLYVAKNIQDFYRADFDDAWAVGVLDVGNELRLQDGIEGSLEIAARGQGINSGCMLMNLEKLRTHNITIDDYLKIIDELERRKQPYFGDQALLNCFLMDKKVKHFPIQYNYMWLEHDEQNILTRDIDLESVKVFHCGGNEYKPWSVLLRKQDIELIQSKSYLLKQDISERRYLINRGWWEYAKYAPNFQDLLANAVSYSNILSVIDFNSIECAMARR